MSIEGKTSGFLDISKIAKPVSKERASAFERRIYEGTKDAIMENERWAKYSLENSFSYVFL